MAVGECHGFKKNGDACMASAVMPNGFCIAHQSLERRVQLGHYREHGQPGSGRKKRVTASAVLRARVEAQVDEVLKPLFDGLVAEKAVVVSGGQHAPGFIEYVDDMPTRLRAAAEMLDRVYGKAKQTTEIAGSGGGPIRIEVPRSAERAVDVARILAGAGALPSPPTHGGRSRRSPSAPAVPVRAPTNGHHDTS